MQPGDQTVKSDRPTVAILKCRDYDPRRVEDAVRQMVGVLGGLSCYIRSGQRVVIKPNLLRASSPEAAATTHPAVVRAVVRLVQEAGATPVIADSPGGPYTRSALRRVYERTGMCGVAEETGAELNEDVGVTSLPNPDGILLKRIDVISAIAHADAVINLPKLKTHNLTRLTNAVKNLFGVVPGVTKIGYHAKLQDARTFSMGLLDIFSCVRPVLTITDAIVAMQGDGPSGGDPYDGQVLLGGSDALALDVVAAMLAGWDPMSMPIIQVAVKAGLTTGRVEDIAIRGEPLGGVVFRGFRAGSASVMDPGLLPRGLFRLAAPLLKPRACNGTCPGGGIDPLGFDVGTVPRPFRRWATRQIVVTPRAGSRCTGCGRCVEQCPVNAIRLVRGRARMDSGRCIRCYCCNELCPELAVDLRRPWFGRLFFGA